MHTPAVIYARSSKDRADISIEVQVNELKKLAAERGYVVTKVYRDVVESGKDDDRPGFQELFADIRTRDRGWATILVLDTSRLARRMSTAVMFEEECRGKGIAVVYKSLPEIEEAERALIKAVFHGVDEWHSLVSRRKGIAGMRQNVKNGFRAGGRAPLGYKLEHVDTGAVREGKPVLKSRLALGADAQLVQRYLKERAAGAARRPLAKRLDIKVNGRPINESSLIGIEWNALTYAGHTAWNIHAEAGSGTKRRPRSEWEIRENTHAALISDQEAETLLTRLEQAAVHRVRRRSADYLLTGLLRTSEGKPWYGDRHRYYRIGNAFVPRRDVDQAICARISSDLRSKAFSEALVRRVRESYGRRFGAELQRLRRAERTLAQRISRFLDMAERQDFPGPIMAKVAELEQERKAIAKEIERAARDAEIAGNARSIGQDQVSLMLDTMAEDLHRFDQEKLKDFLHAICERVTLHADTLEARIHYRIPLARRDKLASPRGLAAIPLGKAISYVKIRRAA